ncbi:hypothetical protein [Pedobacter lusitanus]|uniref:hypothetical protein n=1 Tax=Pedobacter lusitanus TaxID=1503925 RepID=UPI000696CD26|nr:hypothetical protein [Pedobacter lusitanus]
MKSSLTLLILTFACQLSFAQTNKFGTEGNAGVGTIDPAGPFHIRGASNKLTGSRNALILDNAAVTGNRSSDVIWTANGIAKWEMGNDVRADGQQSFWWNPCPGNKSRSYKLAGLCI